MRTATVSIIRHFLLHYDTMNTTEHKELVAAWNKRIERKEKSRNVQASNKRVVFRVYPRAVEYDPAFMSEIEYFKRATGRPWHNCIPRKNISDIYGTGV